MALIIPSGIGLADVPNAAEWPTLCALREGLPEDWTVVHGCHWTLPTRRRLMQGEIDFVVISPAGALALIEQKNGEVRAEAGDVVKHYGSRAKSVSAQMARNRDAFQRKLDRHRVPKPTGCISVGYFPDARIDEVHDIALDACCLVDQGRSEQLPQILVQLIGDGVPAPRSVAALLAFLEGSLDLVPSLHGQKALADRLRIQLSGPLRVVLDNFQMQPMRLRVEACAGAGKSELLRVMARRAVAAGRRVLLLCFNRPLAEMHRDGLAGATVETWFGLRRRMADALDIPLAFGAAADWAFWRDLDTSIASAIAARGAPAGFRYDTILVDEGQDLSDGNVDQLLTLLNEDGDFVWMGDPEQDLMERSAARHRGHAVLRVLDNYRTPALLAVEVSTLAPNGVRFMNPAEGSGLDIVRVGGGAQDLRASLAAAVDRILLLGLQIDDLMIIGLQGIAGLDVLGDHVGAYALRRFTGLYSPDGQQLMTAGVLVAESVARAKGRQCAHVMIIAGDHASRARSNWKQLLYVALTRATVGATLFVSDDATRWEL